MVKENLASLDLARAAAAYCVVIGHCRSLVLEDWMGGGAVAAAWYATGVFGHQAVIVFFVLSGFFVGGSAIEALRAKRFLMERYAARRVARLGVVLIPAIFVTIVCDLIGIHWVQATTLYSGNSGSTVLAYDAMRRLDVFTALGNAVFLQPMIVETVGSNGALWSLSYEFWSYFLFPLLLIATLTGASLQWRLWAAGLVVAIMVLLSWGGILLFLIWSMGALVAFASYYEPRWKLSGAYGVLPLGFFLLVLLATATKFIPAQLKDPVLALAFAGFLMTEVWRGARLPQPWAGWAQFSAGFSYSLYAVHFPVVLLAKAVVLDAGRLPFGPIGVGVQIALILLATLAAIGVWYFFERHTAKVQSWLLRRAQK